MREEYNHDGKEIQHADEVLDLLHVMTEEEAFEMLNVPQEERSKVKEMLEE